jgi:hypothetical protein
MNSPDKPTEELPPAPELPKGAVEERDGHSPFPIVGVGASAGGLEAFSQLLSNLPKAGNVLVRVRDTGIGIPPDLLPHVFDIFTQGSQPPEQKRAGGKTGSRFGSHNRCSPAHPGGRRQPGPGPELGHAARAHGP